MRVVQLGAWPPPHGGVQTNMVSIRRYLREKGHFCAVINLTRHRRENADDVYYPKSAAQTLATMRALRGDIYHLHIGGTPTNRLLALSIVCSAMPRSRAVLSFHSGGYPDSPEGRSARPFSVRGFAFRRLDAIIAVNPAIETLFHRFGVAHERVHLIYPFDAPNRSDAPYPEALESFIRSHRPFLFTVGLLEPEYDLRLQIETLGRVLGRHSSAGLVIAGAGSLEGELRRLIASKPWKDHVLLWGDMPHQVTLRALAECDLFLRTTHFDGDSISVREAIGFGTPVIASDNGMRPAGVRLIQPRRGDALEEAIEEMLRLGAERGPLGGGSPGPWDRPPGRSGPGDSNLRKLLGVYEGLMASR